MESILHHEKKCTLELLQLQEIILLELKLNLIESELRLLKTDDELLLTHEKEDLSMIE
jgi:hypothetical protein